jgi:hypothetical protein
MTDALFDVHFAGQLVAGADPEAVRANVAKLFKAEVARIEHLFSGQRVAIKKGVDEATAAAYRSALAKAGAIAEITRADVPAASIVTARPDRTAAAGPPASPPPTAPAGSGRPMRVFATPPSAPDFGVAEPGAILVEPTILTPPQIDTSHLSVAAVGTTLSDAQPVPEPEFDLSAFKLDPPGTILAEGKPVPPANYDTSALKLVE